MAEMKSYQVGKSNGTFRVMRGGKPQPDLDNGGFKNRKAALDAAMKANRQLNRTGTGMADSAAEKIANRRNRIDAALTRAGVN